MLRPQRNVCAIAAGMFMALTTWFATPAKAIVIVEASINGGAFETLASSPTDTLVSLAGVLPNLGGTFSVTLDVSKDYPIFQLNTLNNATVNELIIRATATDLDSPTSVERLLTGYADTVPIGAADIAVESFIDPGNVAFGTAIAAGAGGPINGPVTKAILTQLATPVTPLYSLTLINTLTNIDNSANFTSTLSVVPEPGALGMLGTGLVLAGLILKRRRNRRS